MLALLAGCAESAVAEHNRLRADAYCRGAFSVAKTNADSVAIITRSSGWTRIDGSYCAGFLGRVKTGEVKP